MSRDFQDKTIGKHEYRHWRASGTDARTVILLHGIGSNMKSFSPLANALPKNWNLIAWNAPGYGQSENLQPEFPIASEYAKSLDELVTNLELDNFILIGHSLGTLIATAYAAEFPAKISQLILLASAQGYDQPQGILTPSAQARLADLEELGARRFATARAGRLLFEPEKMPEVHWAVEQAMSEINPEGYTNAVHLLSQSSLNKLCQSVKHNSLVVVGKEDVITPPVQSHEAHETLKNSAAHMAHGFVEIPDAGHAIHQQKPVETANAISRFLHALTIPQTGDAA